MEEIDLKEIFRVVWEQKATVILLVAIFMVIGFIYSSFILVPVYTATTKLLLIQTAGQEDGKAITSSDVTLSNNLLETYKNLLKSNDLVIRPVIANLGLDDSEGSIIKSISITSQTNTQIINLSVKNTNPEKAAQIANEIAKVFIEVEKDLYQLDNVHITDYAEVPTGPSNVNHARDIIIFGAIGFVLAIVYIFIVFMLDNSVKSQEDVEKNIKVPVLANIPIYETEENVGAKGKKKKTQKKSKGGNRK